VLTEPQADRVSIFRQMAACVAVVFFVMAGLFLMAPIRDRVLLGVACVLIGVTSAVLGIVWPYRTD
jgi:hypothetical protein